jgi:hypothetical protein
LRMARLPLVVAHRSVTVRHETSDKSVGVTRPFALSGSLLFCLDRSRALAAALRGSPLLAPSSPVFQGRHVHCPTECSGESSL